MTRAELGEHVKAQCEKIVNCFAYKNGDYGHLDDGFNNFRQASQRILGDDSPQNMFKTIQIYADKHNIALANTGIDGPEVPERLIDVAVYSLIAHALWTETHGRINVPTL